MPLKNLTRDEAIAHRLDALENAHRRAVEAARCPICRHPATLAVEQAERALIETVRSLYREP